MSLLLLTTTLLAGAEGLRARGLVDASASAGEGGFVNKTSISYSFESFVQDFDRGYDAGGEEYAHRAAIFHASLLEIHAANSRADRSWTAGVHPFMDWTNAERSSRLHGYVPLASRRPAPAGVSALQISVDTTLDETTALDDQVYGDALDSFEAEGPPVRTQGICASCWAIAAVEAVEARLMRADSPWPSALGRPQLSEQALVDCVPNPRHCGGKGGCAGATPELAFEYMRDHGIPLEAEVPYEHASARAQLKALLQASAEDAGKCPLEPYPAEWARVSLSGWRALPINQAQPLMQALVQDGPAVVAVAVQHSWYHYKSGIYDDCPKDAIPNHSVLARGYGVKDSLGTMAPLQKYWLIQNSWGPNWGELGSIRLFRHDDEDSWCGVDSRPEQGNACDGEAGRQVTVCGSCGILFDSVIPQVGRILLSERNATPSLQAAPQPSTTTKGATATAANVRDDSDGPIGTAGSKTTAAVDEGVVAWHSSSNESSWHSLLAENAELVPVVEVSPPAES